MQRTAHPSNFFQRIGIIQLLPCVFQRLRTKLFDHGLYQPVKVNIPRVRPLRPRLHVFSQGLQTTAERESFAFVIVKAQLQPFTRLNEATDNSASIVSIGCQHVTQLAQTYAATVGQQGLLPSLQREAHPSMGQRNKLSPSRFFKTWRTSTLWLRL